MPIWFIKAISYIWPVTIKEYTSTFSGNLFVRYFMGKKVLDSKTTNYSFGGLQKVLHRALELLPLNDRIGKILILGLGAGSVVKTLREQFHSQAAITGIDIDEVMITIAREEFDVKESIDTSFVVADAIEWITNNNQAYDLIIIDLFIRDTIPQGATEMNFINHVINSLSSGGQLLFNTIPETFSNDNLDFLIDFLEDRQIEVRKMRKWGYSNNVLLGLKKTANNPD
ncbi:MAG: spermidine synthase [Sediminibacterium sp.]